MEAVHHEFVVSAQSMSSRYFIFSTIAEWISHLRKALELPDSQAGGVANEKVSSLTYDTAEVPI